MRILFDGDDTGIQAANIGQALDAAGSIARDKGRLIVEVAVDGAVWSASELSSQERRGADASEVSLVSAETHDILRDALADAVTAIDSIDERQQNAAELIQADRRTEAMDILGQAMDTWMAIQRVVQMTAQVRDVQESSAIDSDRLNEAVLRLNEQLRAMRDALQADDPIGLADSLLYEMPDVVAFWKDVLITLHGTICAEV